MSVNAKNFNFYCRFLILHKYLILQFKRIKNREHHTFVIIHIVHNHLKNEGEISYLPGVFIMILRGYLFVIFN